MLYNSAQDWRDAQHRRVAIFGMSGLGKTRLSNILRDDAWFHYSVDFRIGTRYMGEHIVDNFKREAMRVPFLRGLLLSDSIYIGSNISFNNLEPLATYLGKPGNPEQGGLSFEDYLRRQRQHREAEIAACLDIEHFISKAIDIYGYDHFICDTSGSLCEIVDPADPYDPVMSVLAKNALPVWIEGKDDHIETLVQRFNRSPKPMYYDEDFLKSVWAGYLRDTGCDETEVDPDAFIRAGYRALLAERLPKYRQIAERWGISVPADALARIRHAGDFDDLICKALETRSSGP